MSEYLLEQLITEYIDPAAPDGEAALLYKKFETYDRILEDEARAQEFKVSTNLIDSFQDRNAAYRQEVENRFDDMRK